MSSNLNAVLEAWERMRALRESEGVRRVIIDVETAEHIRAVRGGQKERDRWLADAVVLLDTAKNDGLDPGFIQRLQEAISEEAKRLGIELGEIEKYRKNSLLLQRIPGIQDNASAAALLKEAGIQQIGHRAYGDALQDGRRITAEREKKKHGEDADEKIISCMIPCLVACEDEFFIAVHDSFQRKVVHEIKERLQQIYPRFGDVLGAMEKKVTQKNLQFFFFAVGNEVPMIVLIRASMRFKQNGYPRKCALLLERWVRAEELYVLDAAVSGGGSELSEFVGKTFRYRTYEHHGKKYPELRHIRDNSIDLYRVILKALDVVGWEVPREWPWVSYPKSWGPRNW